MLEVAGMFAQRATSEWMSVLSERERDEVRCEYLFEGVAPWMHVWLCDGPAERCVLTAKDVVQRSLPEVFAALRMDVFDAPGAMDPLRGPLFWEHVRRRGIHRVFVMADADPIGMASAASWIAGMPSDLRVDVRWPMVTLLDGDVRTSALIRLVGWEKRVVESLTERERDTLRAHGWQSLVDLWMRGFKVELEAFALWDRPSVERVLREACGDA